MALPLAAAHFIFVLLSLVPTLRASMPDLWRYVMPLVRSYLSRFELRLFYRGRQVLALAGMV